MDLILSGRLAQLARVHARHAWGHWFKSSTAHHISISSESLNGLGDFDDFNGLDVERFTGAFLRLYFYILNAFAIAERSILVRELRDVNENARSYCYIF